MQQLTWSDLSAAEQSLLSRAEEMMAFSYSPYSKFCVGADAGSVF